MLSKKIPVCFYRNCAEQYQSLDCELKRRLIALLLLHAKTNDSGWFTLPIDKTASVLLVTYVASNFTGGFNVVDLIPVVFAA